jgi:hypothetical protein
VYGPNEIAFFYEKGAAAAGRLYRLVGRIEEAEKHSLEYAKDAERELEEILREVEGEK